MTNSAFSVCEAQTCNGNDNNRASRDDGIHTCGDDDDGDGLNHLIRNGCDGLKNHLIHSGHDGLNHYGARNDGVSDWAFYTILYHKN